MQTLENNVESAPSWITCAISHGGSVDFEFEAQDGHSQYESLTRWLLFFLGFTLLVPVCTFGQQHVVKSGYVPNTLQPCTVQAPPPGCDVTVWGDKDTQRLIDESKKSVETELTDLEKRNFIPRRLTGNCLQRSLRYIKRRSHRRGSGPFTVALLRKSR